MDRIVRLIIGFSLGYILLFEPDLIPGVLAKTLAGAFAAINLLSALLAFCPMYALARISTAGSRRE